LRILILDDEQVVLKTFSRILDKLGYDSFCTDNPDEIYKNIEEIGNTYDIAFIDLMMPNLDQKSFLPKLRQLCKNIKIILISGLFIDEDSPELEDLDYDMILQKPFTLEDIKEVIEKFTLKPISM